MKALSVHPSFAMTIVTGHKTVECRTWTTSYRGDILICSTAKKMHGLIPSHALGVVTLADIVPFTARHLKPAIKTTFEKGDYAWILENPRCIEPFYVKGKLALWECDHDIVYLPKPANDEEDDALFKKYWEPILF